MKVRSMFLAGLGFLALACRPDEVVDAMDINVGFNTGNNVAQGDIIESEKNINTESGNPYGAFVANIKAELGDDAPFIDLDEATVTLTGDATHDALEDIFEGTLELRIVDDSSGTDVLIASVDAPTGVGPVELEIDSAPFDDPAFQAVLLDGSFKMKFVGTAAATAADANVTLISTLSFRGFK